MVEGRGPAPLLVLSLIEGLDDERSMTVAHLRGGREFYGWSETRHLLASIFDSMNLNTEATGNWKKGKAPNLPDYPRPGSEARTADSGEKKPVTVKDLWARFQNM